MPTASKMWRMIRGTAVVRFVEERLSSATTSERPAKAAARASSASTDESRGRKVTFSFRVVVVLVPCVQDLQPFSEQLWWSEDDYVRFR